MSVQNSISQDITNAWIVYVTNATEKAAHTS